MSEPRSSREQILELMNGFRPACVIGAAAELDLWTALGGQPLSAGQLAEKLGCDLRAITMLLDAVAALGLLEKRDGRYRVPAGIARLAARGQPGDHPAHAATHDERVARLVAVGRGGQGGHADAAGGRASAGRRPTGRVSSPPCTRSPARWPTIW